MFEDMPVKSDVFVQLDKIAKPGAILASNTSALDIDAIAAVTSRPQDVIGLHFFSQAHVMRLLEIILGAKTEPSVLATAVTLARAIGKVGVVVGVCDGFCAHRMLYPYLRQADCLMEEGALPQDIDRALTAFGFAMGPCAMLDMAGQDVAHFVRQRRARDLAGEHALFQACRSSLRAQPLRQQIRGWLVPITVRSAFRTACPGRRSHDRGRPLAASASRGVRFQMKRSSRANQLVNEGARLLAERIVERPSDIDLCYVHGMGFPAVKAGPMRWADSVGLDRIYEAIVALHNQHDDNWAPAALLGELARSGRRFADLDARQWRKHGYAAKAA